MNRGAEGPLPTECQQHGHLQTGAKSFEDLLNQLDTAIFWLLGLGIKLSHENRFSTYRTLVSELAANYEDDAWHKDKARLNRAINALYEVSELVSLYVAFDGREPNGTVTKLREFVQGPEEIAGEEKTPGGISARNTGFELHTAARVARGGYSLSLEKRADVLFDLPNQRGLIECKRVRRSEKVAPNLRHARQQALSDTGNQSADLTSCLLALDLSFVLNPNNVLLESDAPLPEALQNLSGQIAERVDADMRNLWHERLLGVLVRFSCIAASEGYPYYVQWWVFVRNADVSDSRRPLNIELSLRLQGDGQLMVDPSNWYSG